MKVLQLKGFQSLRAFNAFHTLILGLKMLPAYMTTTHEKFFESIDKLEQADKDKLIREAVKVVPLEQEEVEALLSFCTDPNGVPISRENIRTLGPDQMYEMICAVAIEISKIKINLVSEDEKKN